MGIRAEEKPAGVYAHIPFCIRKCPYCDFTSAAAPRPPEDRYVDCLVRELSSRVEKESFDAGKTPLESIYIGGGTPTLFSPDSIKRLIENIRGRFSPATGCEVTIEANPDTVDLERLKGFMLAGANRVSIGIQALNDNDLKALGRTHCADKAEESFHLSRQAGFKNIGVDLIFGVPGQRARDFEASVRKVIALKPEHVSVYGLTIEEGTRFHDVYGSGGAGVLDLPAEEDEIRMYEAAVRLLKDGGYMHYEISNFALPGRLSVHNRGYWLGRDYIGLGASAHSYLSYPLWGRRWWNTGDVEGYMARMEETGDAVDGLEELTREEAVTEALMTGLRMLDQGIDAESFKDRFGNYPREEFRNWAELEREG
ncbi:MAG: radical SAM family heme chaperone HemW, partial [Deltaproteobacteria bacterium]